VWSRWFSDRWGEMPWRHEHGLLLLEAGASTVTSDHSDTGTAILGRAKCVLILWENRSYHG